jgi:SNF2 family DNA or RNA helicase
VLVATYFSVQSAENHLKKFFWETLIVDEAHSIKNEETYLACSLRKLKKKFALLLTGTPLSN